VVTADLRSSIDGVGGAQGRPGGRHAEAVDREGLAEALTQEPAAPGWPCRASGPARRGRPRRRAGRVPVGGGASSWPRGWPWRRAGAARRCGSCAAGSVARRAGPKTAFDRSGQRPWPRRDHQDRACHVQAPLRSRPARPVTRWCSGGALDDPRGCLVPSRPIPNATTQRCSAKWTPSTITPTQLSPIGRVHHLVEARTRVWPRRDDDATYPGWSWWR